MVEEKWSLFLSYLSYSLVDRWGTTVDFTTSFLHSSPPLLYLSFVMIHKNLINTVILNLDKWGRCKSRCKQKKKKKWKKRWKKKKDKKKKQWQRATEEEEEDKDELLIILKSCPTGAERFSGQPLKQCCRFEGCTGVAQKEQGKACTDRSQVCQCHWEETETHTELKFFCSYVCCPTTKCYCGCCKWFTSTDFSQVRQCHWWETETHIELKFFSIYVCCPNTKCYCVTDKKLKLTLN